MPIVDHSLCIYLFIYVYIPLRLSLTVAGAGYGPSLAALLIYLLSLSTRSLYLTPFNLFGFDISICLAYCLSRHISSCIPFHTYQVDLLYLTLFVSVPRLRPNFAFTYFGITSCFTSISGSFSRKTKMYGKYYVSVVICCVYIAYLRRFV